MMMSPFCKRLNGLGIVLALGLVAPTPSWALCENIAVCAGEKTYDHTLDAKLVEAVQAGHLEDVENLLKQGADPNAKANDTYVTPIVALAASENENQDILEDLVKAKANLEATNNQGATPLILAATGKHFPALKYLIESGAKINAATSEGLTALMLAAAVGDAEPVRALIDSGADVNARSTTNGTALIYGSSKTPGGTGTLEVVKMLVDEGADVGVTATNGKDAITIAKTYGLDDIADYLAGIVKRDNALFNAVASAYNDRKDPNSTDWKAIKEAVNEGANPRYSVEDGRTELMFLAYGLPGCDDMLEYFVDHSDVAAQEQKLGVTALHLAVDNENEELVSLLIDAGAPLHVRTKAGKTPLDMAQEKKNEAIIDLLKKAENPETTKPAVDPGLFPFIF